MSLYSAKLKNIFEKIYLYLTIILSIYLYIKIIWWKFKQIEIGIKIDIFHI